MYMMEFAGAVAQKINIGKAQVSVVLELLAEGATIPFIARYRKDRTGNLDEVAIGQIQEAAAFEKEFTERKTFIVTTITEQGKMTDALQQQINTAETLSQLEDIYLPYKPKRKTKAQTARENGLEPLSQWLLQQTNGACETEAAKFITETVSSAPDALQGARDIIAENINEDAGTRERMRKLFEEKGLLKTVVLKDKEAEAAKYKDYFDYNEPVTRTPSHRALAVLRGFTEGFLKLSIEPETESALRLLEDKYVLNNTEAAGHVAKAAKDAYNRLLQPSLESEFRLELKKRADEEAILVFAENLKQLLLSSPLGSKKILAFDPGYRTGCKVVCLDASGELLHNTVIYIHEKNRLAGSEATIRHLVSKYEIETIAVGDGTAGRETEQFIKQLQLNLPIFMVNEDGASVYSASEAAREEFPDQDVTVRGAVSIGRRLMDPLAELVKIDPKSIGVGQYQHDVNQARLKQKLDQTVESCVNAVGVNLNTASKHLLSYVSGIGDTLAKNIIAYRKTIGAFTSREQLKNVPRLGDKAFEQSAGFLRITNATNPLDGSAVHPESYTLVQQIASDLAVPVQQLVGNETLLKQVNAQQYSAFGAHTVKDIINELQKPGLDPRPAAEHFEFAAVFTIEELAVGMILPGIVTNLTRFGAFVDIGVKQDGLVHVSEIAHRYIGDPSEALKLNQKVQVKVLEVDAVRKRIALSIKQTQENPARKGAPQQGQRSNNRQQAAPKGETMQDALAALKQKFTKR
jgi:protein Tex